MIHQIILQVGVTIFFFEGIDQQCSKHNVKECPANRLPYFSVFAAASLFYKYPWLRTYVFWIWRCWWLFRQLNLHKIIKIYIRSSNLHKITIICRPSPSMESKLPWTTKFVCKFWFCSWHFSYICYSKKFVALVLYPEEKADWLIFCSGLCNFISQTGQNNFGLYLSKQLSVKECPDDYRTMTDFISLLTDGNR